MGMYSRPSNAWFCAVATRSSQAAPTAVSESRLDKSASAAATRSAHAASVRVPGGWLSTATALPVSRLKAVWNRPSGTSISAVRELPSAATDSLRSRRRDLRLASFLQASGPLASSTQLVISSITTVSASTALTP